MRVIVRKERPHPGAQLRFTDIDGHRFTAFTTDAKRGQLAVLELRHRRRARCEDRIRCAKDTGLRNLPSRASPRTRSGARSSRWPASCSPGRSCSPWPGCPPLGAETAAPARLRRRRPPGPRRPPPAAAPRRTMAVGRRDHRRDRPPAGHPARLTSPNRPDDQEGEPGAVEPAHPARQPGSRVSPGSGKSTPAEHIRPTDHRRERSRLALRDGLVAAAVAVLALMRLRAALALQVARTRLG